MTFIQLLCVILIVAHANAWSSGVDDNMVIIANSSAPDKGISQSQARLIFTKDVKIWKNGVEISVVTMNRNNEMYSRFAREVLNLYPYQIDRSLERKRYAGIVHTEIVANSQEEMLQIVANTPGAIGYANKVVATNKPVKIIEVQQ